MAIGTIILLVAANYLVFRLLGSDYLRWYVQNGAVVGAVTALIAVAWGELDKNINLISSRPAAYLGACMVVMSLPVVVLGQQLKLMGQFMKEKGSRQIAGLESVRSESFWLLLDAGLTISCFLGLFGLLLLWFLVIVPIQYFVFLVCGSLPRFLLRSRYRTAARIEGFGFQTKLLDKEDTTPEGWWDATFTKRPVALTALFSSLLVGGMKVAFYA